MVAEIWIGISSCLFLTFKELLVAEALFYHGVQEITSKQGMLFLAIKCVEDMEKILSNIQLPWTNLTMAVDLRVENTLAVLRPQALMDYRSILASIGWPPSLTTSIMESVGNMQVRNPLVQMQEDKREVYSQSFMVLLRLQVLVSNRGMRRQNLLMNQRIHTSPGFSEKESEAKIEMGVWTIDELVLPIESKVEQHFSKWSQKPEFIFALSYRITKNLMEGVDAILQPLIDKVRLAGFSAKEAWISAMVKMLAAYLSHNMFPEFSSRFHSETMDEELISSWLTLIDHIIAFDKKMRDLVNSQILSMSSVTKFYAMSVQQPLSLLSLFCDHSDWVEIWAQVELKNAQDHLASKLENGEAWAISKNQESEKFSDKDDSAITFPSSDDYKAPHVSVFVIRMTWGMIEKGWALPSIPLKFKFVESTAKVFLHEFSSILHRNCQELEDLSIMNSDFIKREASAINAARYCESTILEWSEDVSFLEMHISEDDNGNKANSCFSYLFADEIYIFRKLQTDYLMEIISAILVEFDHYCCDYVKNIEKWIEDREDDSVDDVLEHAGSVSHEFIEPLNMLVDRLQVLKLYLNFKDFTDLWRNVAGGLDHFIFKSVLLTDIRFSNEGIRQFRTDMSALFHVFGPFCIRPEAFFPCISDSLKLFAMGSEDVKHINESSKKQEVDRSYPRHHGLLHITAEEAKKILRSRK